MPQVGERSGGTALSMPRPTFGAGSLSGMRCPGPTALSRELALRHDALMRGRAWRRAGWAMFGAALAGLTAYMVSVGWSKANLVAGVAAFFVGAAGLAVALAPRRASISPERNRSGQPEPPSRIKVKVRRVTSGRDVDMLTITRPGGKVTSNIKDVAAKGSVRHWIQTGRGARTRNRR